MKLNEVDNCIYSVNREFVSGLWNFTHERDFQCLLFGYLRELNNARVKNVELVHAEFNSPSDSNTNSYLDIAVMENGSAFRKRYFDRSEGKINNGLPLKVAIEIKYLYSSLDSKAKKKIEKDLTRLEMLSSPNKLSKRCYLLIYIDVDCKGWIINEQIENVWARGYWKEIYQTFNKASKGHKELKVYCVFGKQKRQCRFSNGKQKWETIDDSLE